MMAHKILQPAARLVKPQGYLFHRIDCGDAHVPVLQVRCLGAIRTVAAAMAWTAATCCCRNMDGARSMTSRWTNPCAPATKANAQTLWRTRILASAIRRPTGTWDRDGTR